MNTTIEKIERLNILLISIGALLGWGTGVGNVPSFVLGGIVMQANFWLLKKVVRAVFSSTGGKVGAVFWFTIKGIFFFLLLSALFFHYPVHGESFTVGVSLLLLACVIVSLFESWAAFRNLPLMGR